MKEQRNDTEKTYKKPKNQYDDSSMKKKSKIQTDIYTKHIAKKCCIMYDLYIFQKHGKVVRKNVLSSTYKEISFPHE